MHWIEVTIVTTEEASDAVSDMLSSLGSEGVAIEDPNEIRRQIEAPGSLDYADDGFIDSLGKDVTIRAYFSSEFSIDDLSEVIKEKLKFISRFLDTGKGFAGAVTVDDDDWSNKWKKFYKPFHITERVVIKPSWEDNQPSEGDIVIELDPGMAFGTGSHETTRLCSELIDKYIQTGDEVLDLGCGSGILSIVAAKLGARSVMAVDIDEVAVKTAAENCRINSTESKVEVRQGTLKDIAAYKYDLVVANIIADVIISIAADISGYIKKDGLFIVSGIIRERKDEVIGICRSKGLELKEVSEAGEWVAMVFVCPDSM